MKPRVDRERDDRNHADVHADRYDTLDDASVLLDDGEALVKKIDADDAQAAKEFFRYRRRFVRGER